uniref:Uncharacterized protein n=1 Tax=Timema poppense TaxID=170557 RepID=A0A7R9D882_TIMPO|nr:unnamed protein product [Timema poppensis]
MKLFKTLERHTEGRDDVKKLTSCKLDATPTNIVAYRERVCNMRHIEICFEVMYRKVLFLNESDTLAQLLACLSTDLRVIGFDYQHVCRNAKGEKGKKIHVTKQQKEFQERVLVEQELICILVGTVVCLVVRVC